MAHLNLRERVIETTIAYLGADAGAGASNFAHVGRDEAAGRAGALQEDTVGGARLLSLDWRPRGSAKLNDCELRVKLVSMDTGVSPDAVQSVLVDADGLVLVLESGDAAAAGNDRVVATAREALSRAPERRVPVVVQVNRREGVDGPLEVGGVEEAWPRVSACAAKGDGVMETLQRALEGVVESMHRAPAGGDAGGRPAGAPRVEGNPLLGALRQILQVTVSEQVTALEARLVERLDRQASEAGRAAALEAAMVRLEAAVAAASERAIAAQGRSASREELAKSQAVLASEVKARCEALASEAREHAAVVHEKTSRAVLDGAAQAKAAIDALGAAMRQEAARQTALDLDGAVSRLGARTDGVLQILESVVTEVRALGTKIDAVAPLVQRAAADAGDRLKVASERALQQAEALTGEVSALSQEIRARKKSWF